MTTYKARPDDDAYIRKVARSKDLAEGRRNIFLWRLWVLERTAVLTFRLLKRLQLLDPAVDAFMINTISRRSVKPKRRRFWRR